MPDAAGPKSIVFWSGSWTASLVDCLNNILALERSDTKFIAVTQGLDTIQRFDAIHPPSEILGHRDMATAEFPNPAHPRFRRETPASNIPAGGKSLSFRASNRSLLRPAFMRAFLRGLQTMTFVNILACDERDQTRVQNDIPDAHVTTMRSQRCAAQSAHAK